MIIHWSEYTTGPGGKPSRCAIHGETGDGHRFHICSADTAHDGDEQFELWVEGDGSLDYLGHFPSETAARIHAERTAAFE